MNQPLQEEERDDAVVGRAFVWSASLILTLLVIGGGIAFWTMNQRPAKIKIVTEFELPETRKAPALEIPEMPFQDITASAGIEFQHDSGAAGEKLLPETMGELVRFSTMTTTGIRICYS